MSQAITPNSSLLKYESPVIIVNNNIEKTVRQNEPGIKIAPSLGPKLQKNLIIELKFWKNPRKFQEFFFGATLNPEMRNYHQSHAPN